MQGTYNRFSYPKFSNRGTLSLKIANRRLTLTFLVWILLLPPWYWPSSEHPTSFTLYDPVTFNLQPTVRGPMDPVALLTSFQKVIIRISKPMFHLILPHTEPFCCIKWYLAYDVPAHAKALHSTQKYLGSNGPCHLFHVKGKKRTSHQLHFP